MDDAQQLGFLAARVENLTREKEAALQALQAAAGLGHFDTSYSRLESPEPILAEIACRAGELAPFCAMAVWLVDEDTQDMVLSLSRGGAAGFDPDAEIEALIADHSFAFVLNQPGPAFFRAKGGGGGRLVLHRLATSSRVRGMFLGLLDNGDAPVSDTALALLSVVLNAGAAALESYFLYRHLASVNQGLERKVAARTAQLRRAHDELRLIVDSLPAGVVVIDPADHRIMDINPAGAAMIGQSRDALVGRVCFDCFCPAQRDNCPILDGGRELVSVERIIRDAAGREIPILKTAVRASLAGRDCVIESFVDISEQKKLASLREDVERMTRHDLKGPLTGVIGLPDVLLSDPEFPEDYFAIVEMIKESGLKMLGMINLSLDLYKMETGTYVLDPRPVELAKVLLDVGRELGPLCRARGVAIAYETDGAPGLAGPVVVLGEELLYFSLFSNLLKNAVEASPEEGEVVVAVVGRDMVWVSLTNAGAVPEAVRERFFEKYATSGKAGGTGLGAYSARLIVENLGGRIYFTSDAAAGTTLVCMLPRPKPALAVA
jgi:PAS domain S-box-containing protein